MKQAYYDNQRLAQGMQIQQQPHQLLPLLLSTVTATVITFSPVHDTYRTIKKGLGLVIDVDDSASRGVGEQLPNPVDRRRGIGGIVIQFTHTRPVFQCKVAQLPRLTSRHTSPHTFVSTAVFHCQCQRQSKRIFNVTRTAELSRSPRGHSRVTELCWEETDDKGTF